MNWFLFAVLAWFALGLETGLKPVLEVRPGALAMAPSFVIPLAVFIAMCAPPQATLWSCLILGAMLDLTSPATTPGALVVLGPYALGMLLAGQFVLALRGLMIRRNPLSMVLLSIGASVIAHITVTALFTLRAMYAGSGPWDAAGELMGRLGSSVYTGLIALPLSLALLPLAGAMGFPLTAQRHFTQRFQRR